MPDQVDPRWPPPSHDPYQDAGTEQINMNWGPPAPEHYEPWSAGPPPSGPALTPPLGGPVIPPPAQPTWWKSAGLWVGLVAGVVIGAAATFAVMSLHRGAPNHAATQAPSSTQVPASTQVSTSPPSSAAALPPNTEGVVYISTKSGKTHCAISTDSVTCEAQFTDSPIIDGQHANDVKVTNATGVQWTVGNMGTHPDTVTLDYQTYHAQGWTIVASSSGTRFTNDQTGHGMLVSVSHVDAF